MGIKKGNPEFLEYNWSEHQIEIICDLLKDGDMERVEELQKSDQSYFNLLDTKRGFVDEVTKLSGNMELSRAFWIINLAYVHYFRKPKFKNVHVFYRIRDRVMAR